MQKVMKHTIKHLTLLLCLCILGAVATRGPEPQIEQKVNSLLKEIRDECQGSKGSPKEGTPKFHLTVDLNDQEEVEQFLNALHAAICEMTEPLSNCEINLIKQLPLVRDQGATTVDLTKKVTDIRLSLDNPPRKERRPDQNIPDQQTEEVHDPPVIFVLREEEEEDQDQDSADDWVNELFADEVTDQSENESDNKIRKDVSFEEPDQSKPTKSVGGQKAKRPRNKKISKKRRKSTPAGEPKHSYYNHVLTLMNKIKNRCKEQPDIRPTFETWTEPERPVEKHYTTLYRNDRAHLFANSLRMYLKHRRSDDPKFTVCELRHIKLFPSLGPDNRDFLTDLPRNLPPGPRCWDVYREWLPSFLISLDQLDQDLNLPPEIPSPPPLNEPIESPPAIINTVPFCGGYFGPDDGGDNTGIENLDDESEVSLGGIDKGKRLSGSLGNVSKVTGNSKPTIEAPAPRVRTTKPQDPQDLFPRAPRDKDSPLPPSSLDFKTMTLEQFRATPEATFYLLQDWPAFREASFLALLDRGDVARLPDYAFKHFTRSDINLLGFNSLQARHFAFLGEAVSEDDDHPALLIRNETMAHWSPLHFSYLSDRFIHLIPAHSFRGINGHKLGSIKPESLVYLTAAQIREIPLNALDGLSPLQMEFMGAKYSLNDEKHPRWGLSLRQYKRMSRSTRIVCLRKFYRGSNWERGRLQFGLWWYCFFWILFMFL